MTDWILEETSGIAPALDEEKTQIRNDCSDRLVEAVQYDIGVVTDRARASPSGRVALVICKGGQNAPQNRSECSDRLAEGSQYEGRPGDRSGLGGSFTGEVALVMCWVHKTHTQNTEEKHMQGFPTHNSTADRPELGTRPVDAPHDILDTSTFPERATGSQSISLQA